MDERGLWRLFAATGLPAAWLALRQLEREREKGPAHPDCGREEQAGIM